MKALYKITVFTHPAMQKPSRPVEPENHIVLFQEATIRRVWHNEEWWFALSDVIVVLTNSADPRQYIKKMRSRDPALDANWGATCTPPCAAGPGRQTARDQLRQHRRPVPHHPVHPLTQGRALQTLAGASGLRAGEGDRKPELASARARELYQAKGYPQAWIEKRLRSISVRGELIDEWKARGVTEGKEYSILTAEIALATFGVTPGEHSQPKGLEVVKTGNPLRDHMTGLELIFTMLGEASTTEIARRSDALGFVENRTSAKQGGTIAGNARKALEAKTGKAVVSNANYLATASTPDLLQENAPSQPAKPKVKLKSNVRGKTVKGRSA